MAALVTAGDVGNGDQHEGWCGGSWGCATHELMLAQPCPTAQGAAPDRKRDQEGRRAKPSSANPMFQGEEWVHQSLGQGDRAELYGATLLGPAPAPSGELRAVSFWG